MKRTCRHCAVLGMHYEFRSWKTLIRHMWQHITGWCPVGEGRKWKKYANPIEKGEKS